MIRAFVVTSAVWIAGCAVEDTDTFGLSTAELVPVTVTIQRGDGAPLVVPSAVFAAFQEGDGPWLPLPFEDGAYRMQILEGRYGLALGFRMPNVTKGEERRVSIIQTTTAEQRDHVLRVPFDEPTPSAHGGDPRSRGGRRMSHLSQR